MSAFLAIVLDTWRQSIKQVVFMIMLVLLLLISAIAVFVPAETLDKNGERCLRLIGTSSPMRKLDYDWIEFRTSSLMKDAGVKISMDDLERVAKTGDVSALEEEKGIRELRRRADRAAKEVPRMERHVQAWVYNVARFQFTMVMLLFIAACSGYFPDTLAAGAVDILVSKPVARLKLFLGKYVGGLVLLAAAVGLSFLLIYAGLGLRFGVWHWRIFLMLPLTVFCGALLYAILAFVGVLWRSTSLGIVLGYLFYIVVDFILGIAFQAEMGGAFDEWPWASQTIQIMRKIIPNFEMLKGLAMASSFNLPHVSWQPLVTAVAWLFGTLGLGYWVFRRRDF